MNSKKDCANNTSNIDKTVVNKTITVNKRNKNKIVEFGNEDLSHISNEFIIDKISESFITNRISNKINVFASIITKIYEVKQNLCIKSTDKARGTYKIFVNNEWIRKTKHDMDFINHFQNLMLKLIGNAINDMDKNTTIYKNGAFMAHMYSHSKNSRVVKQSLSLSNSIFEKQLDIKKIDNEIIKEYKKANIYGDGECYSAIEIFMDAILKGNTEKYSGDDYYMNEKHNGDTILYLLIVLNKRDLVEWALKNGAHTNIINDNTGLSPLMYASNNGDMKMIELLLKYNGDILLKDKNGETSIHKALNKGHYKCAKFLMDNINVDETNETNEIDANV